MRVPWTARISNQSILKEISPGISLEGMMLKLKLQYFGHLMRRVDSLENTLMLGGIAPEFTQTHVHQVGDAIQPSHPLSSPSPPAPKPSQHQSLRFHLSFLLFFGLYFSYIFPDLYCFLPSADLWLCLFSLFQFFQVVDEVVYVIFSIYLELGLYYYKLPVSNYFSCIA